MMNREYFPPKELDLRGKRYEKPVYEEEAEPITANEPPPRKRPRKKENFFVEIAKFTLLSLLIVLPIRLFFAQPFIVSGSSMDPTFSNGQYLIVDQITYKFEKPKRNEVIIFRYPRDQKKFFIKRIIGLPGETIELKNQSIIIYNETHPDGVELDEPYVQNKHTDNLKVSLKDNEYFMMGDNRSSSSDSRYWGPLPAELIIGRAFLRLLPIEDINFLPGDYSESTGN
jgi:signal peptidase I